jgi:hypothetical protein
VGGGLGNIAREDYSIVAGGFDNAALGERATVAGGGGNRAFSAYSTVAGGSGNEAGGQYSFAAGRQARVRSATASADFDGDEGTFVWADSTNTDFASTGPNQFLIRASGGMRLATGDGSTPQFQAIMPSTDTPQDLALNPLGGGVGVGTSSPDSELHVHSGDALCELRITPSGIDQSSQILLSENTTGGFGTVLRHDGDSNRFGIRAVNNFVESADYLTVVRSTGRVGIGTDAPLSQLSVYEDGDSATQTVFTQDIANAGVNIVTDYVAANYTPGLFWSTVNQNASKPKAGIYLQETSLGSKMLFGTSNNYATGITNDALIIDPSGNVGVKRTPAANDLEVEGTASKTVAGDWLANSDAAIKTNVRTITGALAMISRLRPVAFRYNDQYQAAHPSIEDHDYYNYIAQEFREVFPQAVQDDGTGLLQMDAHPAGVYAVAAIQELHEIVQEKDCEIEALRAEKDREIAELRQRTARLEALMTTLVSHNSGGNQ